MKLKLICIGLVFATIAKAEIVKCDLETGRAQSDLKYSSCYLGDLNLHHEGRGGATSKVFVGSCDEHYGKLEFAVNVTHDLETVSISSHWFENKKIESKRTFADDSSYNNFSYDELVWEDENNGLVVRTKCQSNRAYGLMMTPFSL